ncbi:MAG: extracellular solute-binding protein [Anaerolineales bacterium]|nr:extracellular solute-binding protein [Anaerolineales bacterium]
MKHFWLILAFVLLSLGLVGCAAAPTTTGRLIVWHTWDEAEAPVIEQLLTDFQSLNPDIQISVERKEYNMALDEFAEASRAGLGPDMLIGLESPHAHLLYDYGLVANLNEMNIDWTVFNPATLQSVQSGDDARVGVPLNAYVSVMYFNRSVIEEPPTTLEALQAVSAEGIKVGLPTTFFAGYWGITGVGGSVFDGDALADDSAVNIAKWLEWLAAFQQTPGAVLSPDIRALVDSFAKGDIDLLMMDSLELAALEEQLGSDQLGVALIPGSPNSQPFSNVELIVVNSASVQQEAAARLSNFLCNETQQRKLARSTSGRAPVNRVVNLNATLFPRVSMILQQNQTAVVPTTRQDNLINRLIVTADPIYQQVLEGLTTPMAGAQFIVDTVNQEGR